MWGETGILGGTIPAETVSFRSTTVSARLAANKTRSAETETRIEELIAAPSFPARGDVAAQALQEAQATYPSPVRRALQRRIAARMELPHRAREFLAGGDALDEGPVVDALLDAGLPKW